MEADRKFRHGNNRQDAFRSWSDVAFGEKNLNYQTRMPDERDLQQAVTAAPGNRRSIDDLAWSADPIRPNLRSASAWVSCLLRQSPRLSKGPRRQLLS